jgi:hypothetical protein
MMPTNAQILNAVLDNGKKIDNLLSGGDMECCDDRKVLREVRQLRGLVEAQGLVQQRILELLENENLAITFHVGKPTEQVIKETKMANVKIAITDSQQVVLGPITYTDKRGNPTPPPPGAQPPVWVVDNTQLLTITPTPDGASATLSAVGPLGDGTVSVSVSAADGTALATGAGDVTVSGGAPAQVSIPVGAPTEEP